MKQRIKNQNIEFPEIEIEVPKVQYHEFVRLRC